MNLEKKMDVHIPVKICIDFSLIFYLKNFVNGVFFSEPGKYTFLTPLKC